ncbi:SPOR domain-containing protein [Tropicibacter naphthalenivorans]|uniref:Cell division protein FtsN n=1 Tax=Tropicibacter naphthalenivorans TaxID=441103 RepID=A0A0P1G3K5_9RHOB|nr:SPOR domain-containing protein [Tropicibacter naphthalenivorans]CUH76266.1 cell division protein FtsN [Tropicibacter naphthalenivorans]SMC39100.1 Sporulation related domain-containing protein [Tropicibacter naphthalenivorans]
MSGESPNRSRKTRIFLMCTAIMTLSACADGQMPGFLQPKAEGEVVSRAASAGATTTERDVEAPEIFQATEAGLWDGRPSLGGVWVAHPDVTEPERAIIRNEANGKYVIGALFRRQRETPGPRLQVSSDAAAALGILAGAPSNLNVVALRREEVAVQPDPAPLAAAAKPLAAVPAAAEVTEGALDPVLDSAAKALDAAPAPAAKPTAKPATKPVQTAALSPAPAPKPAPKQTASKLAKPFIQIGIFSVEQNAKNTATAMRQAGMVPTVKTHTSQGKTFYRVVVGPAQTKDEVSALLKKIKGTGFTDAYAVTN